MVERCGFFIENDKIRKRVVNIRWDMGFNTWAKLEYIERLYKALVETGLSNILDITSANKTETKGNRLSPLNIYMLNGDSIEDYYKATRQDSWNYISRMLYFDWLYGSEVLKDVDLIDMVKKYDVFTDVFHRPNENHCTQAFACIVLKLTIKLGITEYYKDFNKFYEWHCKYVGFNT